MTYYILCSRPEPEDSDENDNAQEWEELHSEDTYQDSKFLPLHDESKYCYYCYIVYNNNIIAQVEIDEETFPPVQEEGRLSQNVCILMYCII